MPPKAAASTRTATGATSAAAAAPNTTATKTAATKTTTTTRTRRAAAAPKEPLASTVASSSSSGRQREASSATVSSFASTTTSKARSTASRAATTISREAALRGKEASASSSAASSASSSKASATTSTRSTRATSTSTRASSQPRATKAAPVATATSTARPTKAQSTEPPAPLTEEQILVQLAKAPKCSPHLVSAICCLLGTSASELELELEESNEAERATYVPLSLARSSYLAKQIVNAILGSTTELINSGWTLSSAASSEAKGGRTSSKAAGPSARSATTSSRAASAKSNATGAMSTRPTAEPANGPSPASAKALVSAFRVASRFLLRESAAPRSAAKKGKELEVETVMLRYVDRLVALGFRAAAAEEVLFLRRQVYDGRQSSSSAASLDELLQQAILLAAEDLGPSRRTFFVELQSQAANCRLQTLEESDIVSFANILERDDGPLAWQALERQASPSNVKVADRAAYLVERAISRCLQRLGSPTGATSLPLRSFALRMLLMISDIDTDAFWDRAARIGTSCVRTEASEGGDAKEAFDLVQQMFQLLVDAARRRSANMCSGEGYMRFCDNWIALAKKVGSTDSIDQATEAMASASLSSPAEDSREDRAGPTPTVSDDLLVRVLGKLVKAVVALDQILKDENSSETARHTLSESHQALQGIVDWPSSTRPAALVKLYRVLDQVRRRSLMMIDGSTKSKAASRPTTPDGKTSANTSASPSETIAAAIQLLDRVMQLQTAALKWSLNGHNDAISSQDARTQIPSPLEQLTNLVYTYRFLANGRFQVASRLRQEECFAYLSRCSQLLEGGAEAALPVETRMQNLHLISSSYYSIGGRLYSDRQYAAAVRFLERACQAGSESIRLYEQVKADRMDDGDEDEASSAAIGGALEEEADKWQAALSRQWEHLAVSYRLSSNKAKAVSAYREAIFSLPDVQWQKLEEQASRTGAFAIFRQSGWSTLAGMLKSTIELCVLDLFKPQDLSQTDSSIATWMVEFSDFPFAAALMLEHCVASLEPRYHHEEAVAAAAQLLDAAGMVYEKQKAPVRQARILLRKAEMELFSAARGLSLAEIEALLEQACAALSAADAGDDAGLVRYLPQYRATLALLKVEAERRRASSSSLSNIVQGIKQACRYLTPLIAAKSASPRPSIQTRPSPASAKTGAAAAIKRVASSRPTPSTRVLKPNNVPPQPKAAFPVTPPPRSSKMAIGGKGSRATVSPLLSTTVSARASSAGPSSDVLDHPERFCSHLEQVYESLSTYGHTPSSIEIAKVLRRLCQSVLDGPLGRDTYLRVSASLAKQYLHLGKLPRAASVLNQALTFFQTADMGHDISDDTKFRCLMVSAEYLCRTGMYERSVQRFEEAVDLVRRDAPKGSSMQVALEKCRSIERRAIAAEVHSTILYSNGDLVGAIQSAVHAVRFGARMTTLLGRLTAPPSKANDQQQDRPSKDIFSAPTSDIHLDAPAGPSHEAESTTVKQPPRLSSFTVAAMHWRVSKLLVQAYLRVSQLYSVRGSGSDAEAFAGDGIELADAMTLSLALTRALIQRGEIRLQLGQIAPGQDDLSRSLALLQENWIPEAIVLTCIQGDSLARIEQLPEALKSYAAGEATLRTLNATFTELDAILPSPRPAAPAAARRSSPTSRRRRSSVGADALLPEVQGRLLRRQAWILQLLGRTEESEDLIEKAMAIHGDAPASIDAKFDQFLVQGRVSLRRALQQLKSDRLLSMLPDAAISVPMVPSSISSKALSTCAASNAASAAAIKSAMNLLLSADASFTDALNQGGASSHALAVREAFVSLAQVQTMQATLGKGSVGAAEGAAALVDSALSVNVRRDLVHSIGQKLKDPTVMEDPNAWPSFKKTAEEDDDDDDEDGDDSDGSVRGNQDEAEVLGKRLSKLGLSSEPDAIKVKAKAGPPRSLSEYWKLVKERHEASQGATTHNGSPDLLPRNWTVLSLTYLRERETLLLTRQTGGGGPDGCLANKPTIYSLPLDRQSKREMEQGELTMEAAQQRLQQIVRSSNDGIHGAKDVEGLEARKRWWTVRRELDQQLEALLSEMQNTWLGAFKGVFADPVLHGDGDGEALATLRSRFDKIIKRACFPPTTTAAAAHKKTSRLKLDDAVFECFAGFPADSTDEDFEDLLHYVMDALQFGGLQVAVDEVDLDEVAIDLRNALEEFRGKQAKAANATASPLLEDGSGSGGNDADHHLFLVLDKETAMFPWESMPILRRRAVSRIPSMAFLQDRIDLARVYHQLPDEEPTRRRSPLSSSSASQRGKAAKTNGTSSEAETTTHSASWRIALRNGKLFNLSKRRTTYLLNPSGDLVRTQERFEPWLQSHTGTRGGWRGIIGREPVLDELVRMLSDSDLHLYFGHAGAEQYLRRSKLRELKRCAVTMLFGCSSALLRNQGEFDSTGTPLNYMCAGAPAMVGNLWDTTDRELDSVCEAVLKGVGFMDHSTSEAKGIGQGGNLSLVRAVALARDCCKLPFLTGAACVYYGVPVYWARKE
ncbi:separin protein [Thecaphora frezii]